MLRDGKHFIRCVSRRHSRKTYRCLEKNESAFSCSFSLKSWAQSSIMEQKFSGTPRLSYSEITLSESFFTLSYGNIASFFSIKQKGGAIILVSSDIEELLGMADRIMVISHGQIALDENANLLTKEALLKAVGY